MFPKRNLEKIVEKVAIDFNIEINYLSDNWIILLNGVYYEYARWNCPYRQINNFS